MKTAHQLARELFAGPDLPIYHFDPSRAGTDSEVDTSISTPKIELVDQKKDLSAAEIVEADLNEFDLSPFLTIVGDTDLGGEAASDREIDSLNLLRRFLRAHALKTEEQESLRQETIKLLKSA